MKRLLVALCLFASCTVAQNKTIFIVRHGEKISEEADAVLSEAGHKRAQCLADTLRDANLRTIYTSELKRTQQTAAPVADASGLRPKVVPAKQVETLVRDVMGDPATSILIVNHGNLIPKIVGQLGAGDVPPMAPPEYDRMILVQIVNGHVAPAVTLRYCVQPPAPK